MTQLDVALVQPAARVQQPSVSQPLAPLYWGLLVSTLLAAIIALGTFWLVFRSQDDDQWVRHSLAVRNELQLIQTLTLRAESAQRGYLVTGLDDYLAPFAPAREGLATALDQAATLIGDNPPQVQAVRKLRQLIGAKLDELQRTITLRKSGHADEALAVVNTDEGRSTMRAIAAQIAAMQGAEDGLLARREADAASLALALQLGSIAAFLVICLVAVLAAYLAKRSVAAIGAANVRLSLANRDLIDQISRREQAETQLRQSQKMEAVGQLTGGMAHDFNNMLGVIVGALDLMRRRLRTDEYDIGRLIESAMKAAERSTALIQRLLAFARQQPLAPEAVDANRMIADMSDLLRSTLGEQVQIETVPAAGLWKTKVDPHQLESAIVNIAINARDAMPEGGKLTIETGNVYLDEAYCNQNAEVGPGQYVMIAVSDKGMGMAPEVAARAFDPFFTTKPAGKGTGLGLSQVYGFIKQSLGHIKIYSEPGTGTTVKIYLPRLHETVEGTKRAVVQPANGGADELVLVVEDDALVRSLSCDALRALGYGVLESETGAHALEIIEQTPDVSLLFTDVVMPEMNGKKLAEEAVKKRPDLKVLFATGYTRNAVVHGGVLDPGVNFISKPFTVQQLASKVRAVLDFMTPPTDFPGMNKRYQVVIVGGGPVGVALAVELGLRGVACALVERRLEPQKIPKGQNLTQRAMEHFHSWGIAEEVRAARLLPADYPMSGIVAYRNLSSAFWYAPPLREIVNSYYFQQNERLPQYLVEYVLRGKLAQLENVETRFGATAETVEHDADGARVAIVKDGGEHETLHADYVVGCDGGHSIVRRQIGIARSGSDFDQPMVLALFRSRELHEKLKRFPPRSTYRVLHPDLKGYWQFFGRVDVGESWFFHSPVPANTTRDNYDFHGLLQRVAGFPFACDFDYVGFWDLRIEVAEKYCAGRVFIAGDAAHSHPPYGGYGLNNGLDDVANLGWKLAARLQGWGSDALLESYSRERQPIFVETGRDFIAAGIDKDADFLARYSPEKDRAQFEQAWNEQQGAAAPRVLTYEPHYEGSPIVFGPPHGQSSARGSHSFQARAGHHLPPQPLSSGRNVFEELGPYFTLLAFDADDRTVAAFADAATALGVPLKVVRDTYHDGRKAYEANLILIRPDRYVAWTSDTAPDDAKAIVSKAIGRP